MSAGGGPGQLSALNGEFPPLVVAFPTSLLVVDEVPFSGLTGRALSFSRTGQWDRDVTIGPHGSDWVDGRFRHPKATARSIAVVDAATWEAASTDVTGQDDGCQSSFFC